MPQVVSLPRTGDPAPGTLRKIRVLVFIKVDDGVRAKINWVRTFGIATVVLIRIKNLCSKCLPATGRPAVHESRPWLANPSELFFDKGNQLERDRIAVGTQVRGIDGVGIVVKRIGMLNLDQQDAREIWTGPLFEKIMRLLLNDPVVSVQLKSLTVFWFEIGIGGFRAKAPKVMREMTMVDDQRITSFGVGVKAFGQNSKTSDMIGALFPWLFLHSHMVSL